jgi:hypothetical protein
LAELLAEVATTSRQHQTSLTPKQKLPPDLLEEEGKRGIPANNN